MAINSMYLKKRKINYINKWCSISLLNSALLTAVLLPASLNATGNTQYFLGYDIGQMGFHNFNYFAGEAGIVVAKGRSIRVAYLDVFASAKELASDFIVMVDGDSVEGFMKGTELFYDMNILDSEFYLSVSTGYYIDRHKHIILNQELEKKSFTLGTAIGVKEIDVFQVKGLYYNLSLPIRYYFNPIKETKLGNTVIKDNQWSLNIFFNVGYQF